MAAVVRGPWAPLERQDGRVGDEQTDQARELDGCRHDGELVGGQQPGDEGDLHGGEQQGRRARRGDRAAGGEQRAERARAAGAGGRHRTGGRRPRRAWWLRAVPSTNETTR
ncbi:hypothetical protein SZ60_04480 [Frigoribacterium sp. MEB024]|nr:hypothetical protein SZ60_04480 [Frigoribacterium sp. MEB024]